MVTNKDKFQRSSLQCLIKNDVIQTKTNDRPVSILIDQWFCNVYWHIIGYLYCMTLFFIRHYKLLQSREVNLKFQSSSVNYKKRESFIFSNIKQFQLFYQFISVQLFLYLFLSASENIKKRDTIFSQAKSKNLAWEVISKVAPLRNTSSTVFLKATYQPQPHCLVKQV